MVEYTLEELISHRKSLGYEFNPDDVAYDLEAKEAPENRAILLFLKNDKFMETYRKNSLTNYILGDELQFMMPLAMMYSYYFALDYRKRKSDDEQKFNKKYIVESISAEKMRSALETTPDKKPVPNMVEATISEEATTEYDFLRKRRIQFLSSITKIKDPKHFNPYFSQPENDYFGNISVYFRKVLGIRAGQNQNITEKEMKIKDLLPAITLSAIEISALLPNSSKTESGTFNFSRLEKIDKSLCNHISMSTTVPFCKHSDLLHSLVSEDLFFMNRLNNTLNMYLSCIGENICKVDKEIMEKKVIMGVYAPCLFLPSFAFQERYKNEIQEAAKMLIGTEKIDETFLNTVFDKQLPAFFAANIVFPQLLVVLMGYMFLDESGMILSGEKLDKVILKLEIYIDEHQEEIKAHIGDKKAHIWNEYEDSKYVESLLRNKGLVNGDARYEKQKRLNTQVTKLGIEKISRYLIEPVSRWKYTTIIEKNAGIRDFFEQTKLNWHIINQVAFPAWNKKTDKKKNIYETKWCFNIVDNKKCWEKLENVYELFIIVDVALFINLAFIQFKSVVNDGEALPYFLKKGNGYWLLLRMF